MDNYIFVLVIFMILILFVALFIFIKGGIETSKIAKLVIIASVVLVSIGVVFLTYSMKGKLENTQREIVKLNTKLDSVRVESDSLLLSNDGKVILIDSLNQVKQELNNAIIRIKSQEVFIGKNPVVIRDIQDALNKTSEQLDKVETYNEIINDSSFDKIIRSNDNMRSFARFAQISNFVFNCPQKTEDEYMTLTLQFNDDKIVGDIAAIYITIYSTDRQDDSYIMRKFYKAQKGLNKFVIKNELKRKNVQLEIGFFLKSELDKEYPNYEKIICSGFNNDN